MTEVISRNTSVELQDQNDFADCLDENQLAEYQEMVEELGNFPDKVKINTLAMIAEDYADSITCAEKLYQIIHNRLLSTTNRDNILPIVYVIDSILKNAKGCYIHILEKDAIDWMPIVYQKLHETQRAKLEKVWKTWNEFKLFSSDSWKTMGQCFGVDDRANNLNASSSSNATLLDEAGIMRTKDGTLLLPGNLRKKMQSVLDEIQSEVKDELEKVSLERLADINSKLLIQIKVTAESLRDQSEQVTASKTYVTTATHLKNSEQQQQKLPSFFTETRSPQALHIAKEWNDLKSWKPIDQGQEVIRILENAVKHGGSMDSSERYTKDEAIKMTQYYATVSATVHVIKSSVDRIIQLEQLKQHKTNVSVSVIGNNNQNKFFSAGVSSGGSSFAVDRKEFTNEGIKRKNLAVIGLLYEVGLPFVSSLDGRRFRTQVELSKHLDTLFKRNQWEKSTSSSLPQTQERGWYVSDSSWISGIRKEKNNKDENDAMIDNMESNDVDNEDDDNEINAVPADESRDRCIICGIKFKMYFDSEDGIYKYSNCKEIEVLNDDAVENEFELKLVHGSCWKGLGSPEVLTLDQTLQENL